MQLAPGISNARCVPSRQVSEQGWQFAFVSAHLGSERAHLFWQSRDFVESEDTEGFQRGKQLLSAGPAFELKASVVGTAEPSHPAWGHHVL